MKYDNLTDLEIKKVKKVLKIIRDFNDDQIDMVLENMSLMGKL